MEPTSLPPGWCERDDLKAALSTKLRIPKACQLQLYLLIVGQLKAIVEPLLVKIFKHDYTILKSNLMVNVLTKYLGERIGLPMLPQQQHCDMHPVLATSPPTPFPILNVLPVGPVPYWVHVVPYSQHLAKEYAQCRELFGLGKLAKEIDSMVAEVKRAPSKENEQILTSLLVG